MRALAPLALCMLLAGGSAALAQAIPPSEMAGRERFRFQESPGERFMKPGPYVAPNVIEQPHASPKRQARKSKKRS